MWRQHRSLASWPMELGTPDKALSAPAGPSETRKGVKGSSVCVTRPILFRPQTGSRSRLRVNGFPSEPYPLAATNGHVEVEVKTSSSLELCDCYVVWSGCVC